MSDGKHPPRTPRARQAHRRGTQTHHRAHTPHATPGGHPPGIPAPKVAASSSPHLPLTSRSLAIRLAPPMFVLGVVFAVLVGRGFWLDGTAHRDAALVHRGAEKARTGDELPEGSPLPVAVNVPGGVSTAALRGAEGSPAFTGYLARPGAIITTVAQRVAVVPARRDETLDAIAKRTGVSVVALMHANGVSDPTRPLTVGQAVRVPPSGTMLHRVREGDTLEGIARAYRLPLDEIARYPGNNVQQTGDLVPGNFLIVPTVNPPIRDRVVFYQMREGDSLAKTTALYGLRSPRTLQWANSLGGEIVRPGQIIAIPPTDGVIHVVEGDDLRRSTEDAVTQIAKNYACESLPCTAAPADDRVNALAEAVFTFGPNHLTRGGKLVPGQEIMIPGGVPFLAPPPVVIPENVRIDNPTITSGGAGENTVVRRITAPAPSPAPGVARPTPVSGINRPISTLAPAPRPAPAPAPVYAGGGVAGTAMRYIGQYRQPSGVPWAGYCEKFVGDVAQASGVGITRYPTAISHAYAGPLYRGRAPAGALVFFDTRWNSAGHVGIAMGDGTMVSALNGGVVRTSHESAGYMGWRPVG